MRPRRRRTDPDQAPWSFRWLVVTVILLEVAVLLWLTGAMRNLSPTG